MEKVKEKITIQNLLCVFIIMCPILDMLSFIFRNTFNTYISPSTVLRPIITCIVAITVFIKCKFKRKNYNCEFYLFIVCYSPFTYF
jgi:hypothetical protein